MASYQVLNKNPSWLTPGKTSGHQNLVSIFPGIDKASRLNDKGLLSSLCCWKAAVTTLDQSWNSGR